MIHPVTKKLQEEYGNDEEWRPFMVALAEAKNQTETIVDDLMETLPEEGWNRPALIEGLRDLASIGVLGKFKKGARGKQSRFVWAVPPRIVARAALGEADELSPLLFEIEGPALPDASHYVGKDTWTYGEILDLLTMVTGVEQEAITFNLKLGEAKEILANSQGISIDEVSIMLG